MKPYVEISENVFALPLSKLNHTEKFSIKKQLKILYGTDSFGRKGYCLVLSKEQKNNDHNETISLLLPEDYYWMWGISANDCRNPFIDSDDKTIVLVSGYGETIPADVKYFIQKEYGYAV